MTEVRDRGDNFSTVSFNVVAFNLILTNVSAQINWLSAQWQLSTEVWLAYRQQILSLYAQQLDMEELQKLAAACESMSGRDLRDVCEQAERRTASQVQHISHSPPFQKSLCQGLRACLN